MYVVDLLFAQFKQVEKTFVFEYLQENKKSGPRSKLCVLHYLDLYAGSDFSLKMIDMGSVFKRLRHYCITHDKVMPTKAHREELGRVVVKAWFDPENKFRDKCPLGRHEQREPEGRVKALSYPRIFYPVIDAKIHALFIQLKRDTVPFRRRTHAGPMKREHMKKVVIVAAQKKEEKARFSYRIHRA